MNFLEIPAEKKKEYVNSLYECFTTGREFELFLNYFLQKVGFEEVVTTKPVGDKGIDLTCVRKGIDVGGIDTINYYIQAKRYKSTVKVQASEVRDLKGSTKYDKNGKILSNNYINVMITTSSFTKGATEEALSNPYNPTILIDGNKLIDMCVENGIGFVFKPVFNKDEIVSLIKNIRTSTQTLVSGTLNNDEENYLVQRVITANDIRARILILPQIIKSSIPADASSITVNINSTDYKLNLDKSHRYLGGISEIYRKCGLIGNDMYIPKTAKWKIIENKIFIVIE